MLEFLTEPRGSMPYIHAGQVYESDSKLDYRTYKITIQTTITLFNTRNDRRRIYIFDFKFGPI